MVDWLVLLGLVVLIVVASKQEEEKTEIPKKIHLGWTSSQWISLLTLNYLDYDELNDQLNELNIKNRAGERSYDYEDGEYYTELTYSWSKDACWINNKARIVGSLEDSREFKSLPLDKQELIKIHLGGLLRVETYGRYRKGEALEGDVRKYSLSSARSECMSKFQALGEKRYQMHQTFKNVPKEYWTEELKTFDIESSNQCTHLKKELDILWDSTRVEELELYNNWLKAKIEKEEIKYKTRAEELAKNFLLKDTNIV